MNNSNVPALLCYFRTEITIININPNHAIAGRNEFATLYKLSIIIFYYRVIDFHATAYLVSRVLLILIGKV